MSLVGTTKTLVRRNLGLWPALELRNRVVLAGHAWRNRAFENGEIAWPDAAPGSLPYAPIACIIPTFRRPQRLVEAVESVLAQDRKDFLIVVVDDGGGLPKLPSDDRLFAISLTKNTGIAGLVRNVGVRLCKSEYIAFLDDDNRWLPNHLSTAIEALKTGPDMVYTAIRRVRSDGSEMDVLSKPFDRRELSDTSCFIDINSVVLKRSAFKPFSRIPRPVGMFPREDWEFIWRVSGNAVVKHIPEVTVEYLVNPESYYTPWAMA